MSQSRLVSAVESVVNVFVGFGVAILSQLAVFPLFNIHVPLSANLQIGAWFTAISLVRSYVIRRWFNGLKFRPAASAAPKADGALSDSSTHPQRGPLDRAEMDAVCRHALIEFSLGRHICYDDALIRSTEAKHCIAPTTKEAANG